MGVHCSVAKEFVGGAVELICAAASDDVDLAAAGASHFSGVAAGLHLEFLHGVGRGTQVEGVECWIGVGRAVEQEIIGIRTIATDADRGALAGPPIERVRIPGLGAMTLVSARNGEHQIDQHAPVERKLFDGDRFYHLAHGRIIGMEQGRLAGYFHNIFFDRNLETQIQRELLADLQTELLRNRGKPERLYRKLDVNSRKQVREWVQRYQMAR